MVEKRVRKAATPAALAEIRYLLAQGFTLQDVGAIIGLNKQTVHRRVVEFGLRAPLDHAEEGALRLVHALRDAQRRRTRWSSS
ncbi:MAG: hypothetical protein AAFQ67_09760 [Pseudomonadota bacterium]